MGIAPGSWMAARSRYRRRLRRGLGSKAPKPFVDGSWASSISDRARSGLVNCHARACLQSGLHSTSTHHGCPASGLPGVSDPESYAAAGAAHTPIVAAAMQIATVAERRTARSLQNRACRRTTGSGTRPLR